MSTMRRPSKSDTCALALEITSARAHAINGAGCFRPRRITMLALFCRAEVHMIFSLYREVLLRRNRTVGRGDRHRTSRGPCHYFTSPRRTSSIAMMVGFLEDVGSTGCAPPCNWRARLAATMMKREVLSSGSSGIVLCALLRGILSRMPGRSFTSSNDSRIGRICSSIRFRRARSARAVLHDAILNRTRRPGAGVESGAPAEAGRDHPQGATERPHGALPSRLGDACRPEVCSGGAGPAQGPPEGFPYAAVFERPRNSFPTITEPDSLGWAASPSPTTATSTS